MVTKERLLYITQNLVFGDKKEVSRRTSIRYEIVDNVLRGRSYGTNGAIILKTAEEIIKPRLARLGEEALIYKALFNK